MARDEDWDELQGRPHKRRPSKGNKKRSAEEQLDSDFAHDEQTKFLDGLAHQGGKYEWMREKRYNTMFRNIESKIQGPWAREHMTGLTVGSSTKSLTVPP